MSISNRDLFRIVLYFFDVILVVLFIFSAVAVLSATYEYVALNIVTDSFAKIFVFVAFVVFMLLKYKLDLIFEEKFC